MKKVILLISPLLVTLSSCNYFSSKNTAIDSSTGSIRDYIFPKGIIKATFYGLDINGEELKDTKSTYQYSTYHNTIVSTEVIPPICTVWKTFIITDTVIYLVNSKSESILKADNFNYDFGYNNCYLKLPPKNGFVEWSFMDGQDLKDICKAYFVKLVIDNVKYDAIKVEKTSFQEGKYLPEYKCSEYYVKGKGLYQYHFDKDYKFTITRLGSEEFDNIPSEKSAVDNPVEMTSTDSPVENTSVDTMQEIEKKQREVDVKKSELQQQLDEEQVKLDERKRELQLNSDTSSTYHIGNYYVNANEAHLVFFHNSPNATTVRKGYFDAQETVKVLKIENGYGYVEFTNPSGQTSKGWLKMSELVEK